jgi:hypothetical protein
LGADWVCLFNFVFGGRGFYHETHEIHEKDTDLILDGIQDKMDVIRHEETKKHEVEKELGFHSAGVSCFLLLPRNTRNARKRIQILLF